MNIYVTLAHIARLTRLRSYFVRLAALYMVLTEADSLMERELSSRMIRRVEQRLTKFYWSAI